MIVSVQDPVVLDGYEEPQPDVHRCEWEYKCELLNGQYQQRACHSMGNIAPMLCPDAVIDLAEIFPNS